jgi:AraC family transcriptional regulator of adaptative response/methylated-DNA-[protein]-cysteine methyltransferase
MTGMTVRMNPRVESSAPSPASHRARHAAAVAKVCRLIERAEEAPPLATLAAAAGLSAWHFHRVFKDMTGVTPKEYATANRARRARAALARSRTVTDAIYAAGFASSGRFYEASSAMLGMTPTQFRAGAATLEIRVALGASSLGAVLVAVTARGVCAILLGDSPEALRRQLRERFPRARLVSGDEGLETTVTRVVASIETPGAGLDLPLDIRGTAFQQRVWRALRNVPPGTTTTYGRLARQIGAPSAARAVAGACAANPLAVAIPCHRVVGKDGALTGYRWGLPRKRALLDRESEGK